MLHLICITPFIADPSIDLTLVLAVTVPIQLCCSLLVKRAWCVIMVHATLLSAVLAHVLMQGSHQAGLGVASQLLFLLVVTFSGRWLIHENARLYLDLQTTSHHLEAATSVLAGCCDAVVWADEKLKMVQDSRQLAALLDKQGTFGSLANTNLLSLFCQQDRTRVQQHLASSNVGHALAVHGCLVDSDSRLVQVELLHAQIQGKDSQHLIGIRECSLEGCRRDAVVGQTSHMMQPVHAMHDCPATQTAQLDVSSECIEEAGRICLTPCHDCQPL